MLLPIAAARPRLKRNPRKFPHSDGKPGECDESLPFSTIDGVRLIENVLVLISRRKSSLLQIARSREG